MTLPQFEQRARQLIDSFWAAVFGAGVYGAWATFANWDAGPRLAFTAGLAHWLMSTLLTYTGTGVMRQCFQLGNSKPEGALLAFSCGLGFTYTLLIGVHHAIGTPHVALTLAAGVIPNLLFCGSYALLLARTVAAQPAEPAADLLGLTASERTLP